MKKIVPYFAAFLLVLSAGYPSAVFSSDEDEMIGDLIGEDGQTPSLPVDTVDRSRHTIVVADTLLPVAGDAVVRLGETRVGRLSDIHSGDTVRLSLSRDADGNWLVTGIRRIHRSWGR